MNVDDLHGAATALAVADLAATEPSEIDLSPGFCSP
jgi:hypothetical protein